uniref:Lipoprotein signal peptidase n=1 Tax=candidate division WOR-3 bacterium TaxID=2052148 RepID=A0A7C6A999_UNCW3
MRIRLFILVSALALFFDQLTKYLVQSVLNPYQIQPLIGDFLRISLIYNPGGIFGIRIFSDASYYLMPLIGIAIVIFFAIRGKSFFYLVAYALILGGALGNLFDRIRMGKVIDFIDIGIKNLRWYTFNLADAYIVVGIIMLLAVEIFRSKPKSESA